MPSIGREAQRQIFWLEAVSGNVFKRLLGGTPGIEIQFNLEPSEGREADVFEAVVRLRPLGGRSADLEQELLLLAPRIFERLRDLFQAPSDARGQRRWPSTATADLYPATRTIRRADVLEGRLLDVSLSGLRLRLPHRPAEGWAFLHLKSIPPLAAFAVAVRVAWGRRLDGGGYEVGVSFPTTAT